MNTLQSSVYYPIAAATHANKSFDLVSVSDVLLDSSVMKFNPLDCQRPELLNKNLVQGKILLCGYSFNFVSGTASIKKVCETAKSLGAAGFVVAVESSYRGTKYDPVPVALPGILITDVSQTKVPISSCIVCYAMILILQVNICITLTLFFDQDSMINYFFLQPLITGAYRLL